jgi:DNA-binding SARP family transcriptional activator/predicted ATPase
MTTFDIRLFGAIEVYRDGQAVSGFRSQKTLALLAYLIVEDRPLTRDYLAGAFWPETNQAEALGHLRRALHNLSRLLPGCLEIDRRTARFRPDAPAVVDLYRLAALVEQGDSDALVQAAALARAPFLEGVYLADCPEMDIWIATRQERWRQQVASLLESLVETYSRQGDYERALPYAQQLVALEPWREVYHRRLMRLFAQTGRRGDALKQYERCRRALGEELALPVSAETLTLYERIVHAPRPPHNLPPENWPLVGREAEIAALQTLLADPGCRLITIFGPGGVGKTRLALAVARRSYAAFLEGAWYVDLTAVESATLLPGAIATAVGLPLSERSDARRQLLEYLSGKEALLALDNFEHLTGERAFLGEIMAAAPATKLLITSRRQLHLREERLFELNGLSYPVAGSFDEDSRDLLDYEAVALLATAVRRYQPAFDVRAKAEAAVTICRLVEGIPLALELAAASGRTMPLDEVGRAITAGADSLRSSLHNVPERHRSLRAVFNHSWAQLAGNDQHALGRLAVFRDGFSPVASLAVTAISPPQMAQLIDHALVQRLGDDRYQMHELLRQYAWEELDRATATAVQQKHALYYLNLVAESAEALDGDEGKQVRGQLALELGNIRLAWETAVVQARWPEIGAALSGLAGYYIGVGRAQECLPLLDLALTASPLAPLSGRLRAAQAHLLVHTNEYAAALKTAGEAVLQAQAEGDWPAEVEAGYALAFAHAEQGNFRDGQQAAAQIIALARQRGAVRFEALLLSQLARCQRELGNTEEALAHYGQALVVARAIPNRWQEMSIESNMGSLEARRGHYNAAWSHLQRALTLAEEYEFLDEMGSIHLNLGSTAFYLGDGPAVRQHYQAAIAAYRRVGDRFKIGLGYYGLAILAIGDEGDFPTARAYLRQALAIYEEKGARPRQAMVLNQLGYVTQRLGEFTEAQRYFTAALDIAQAIEAAEQQLVAYWRLAQLALEVGDLDTTAGYLAQASVYFQEVELPDLECDIQLLYSRYWQERGNTEVAQEYARRACNLARDGVQSHVPACAVRLAHALLPSSDWAAAQVLYQEALTLWQEQKRPHYAVEAQAGLAEVALAQGDLATAVAHALTILDFIQASPPARALCAVEEPARVYWSCYQALQAAGKEALAEALLRSARDWLNTRMAGLPHEQRQLYQQNVAANRMILALATFRQTVSVTQAAGQP